MRAASFVVTAACTLVVGACENSQVPSSPGGPDAGFPGSGGQPDAGSPEPSRFALALTVTGPGAIRSAALASDCRGSCRAEAAQGTAVHLEAVPDADGEFVGWSGDCTGTAACDLTLARDAAIRAIFQQKKSPPPPDVRLDVSVEGMGTVRSWPAGIDCGTVCSATFPSGTRVRLDATPAAGFGLAGFADGCSGATCELELVQAKRVVVRFTALPPPMFAVTVRMTGDGRGRLVSSPPGIECPAPGPCMGSFARGTRLLLTAVPDAISRLTSFAGACGSEPCSFEVTGDAAVGATFELRRYQIVQLGPVAGDVWSSADAMSRSGQWVVGRSGDGTKPALFSPGAPRRLGIDMGFANVVSSSGVVAGSYQTNAKNQAGNFSWHAFRWSNGTFTDLGTLPGSTQSFAIGISEQGIAVGWAGTPENSGQARAVYWNADGIHELGALNQGRSFQSIAFGINSQGTIVGESADGAGFPHAVRFRGPGAIDDLGTLGGRASRALAINDAGHIVGFANRAQGDSHGFFWRDGAMIDAGSLPGDAFSQLLQVNDAGAAVGISYNANTQTTGTLYCEGRLFNLNDLLEDRRSGYVTSAVSVGSDGVIAGTALLNSIQQAVLLRPR